MPAEATPVEEQEPETIRQRLGGQARGFNMLYLMHPRARAGVEKQIETLLRAEIRDLYLSVLTDGSFSTDFPYLSDVIKRLNTGERTLTLVLYFTNGPGMRPPGNGVFTTAFNLVPPDIFRFLMTDVEEGREDFRKLVRFTRPLFALNRALNPQNRNIAIVMLEDNLDVTSYTAMRELARGELAGTAEFMRNPCPTCFPGNDADTAGDALETHAIGEIINLGARDGFTLDGQSYSFPGEPPASNQLGFEQVKALIQEGLQRKIRYFGLWRAARQGLGDSTTPADQRNYEVPTDEQSQLEIELLRYGLTPVATPRPTLGAK